MVEVNTRSVCMCVCVCVHTCVGACGGSEHTVCMYVCVCVCVHTCVGACGGSEHTVSPRRAESSAAARASGILALTYADVC